MLCLTAGRRGPSWPSTRTYLSLYSLRTKPDYRAESGHIQACRERVVALCKLPLFMRGSMTLTPFKRLRCLCLKQRKALPWRGRYFYCIRPGQIIATSPPLAGKYLAEQPMTRALLAQDLHQGEHNAFPEKASHHSHHAQALSSDRRSR